MSKESEVKARFRDLIPLVTEDTKEVKYRLGQIKRVIPKQINTTIRKTTTNFY